MFGLGGPELLLILAIVLIVFGAGKLPQVFSALGKGVKEFRDASETPTTTSTTTTTTVPATTVPDGTATSTTVVRQENVTSTNGTTPTTPVV